MFHGYLIFHSFSLLCVFTLFPLHASESLLARLSESLFVSSLFSTSPTPEANQRFSATSCAPLLLHVSSLASQKSWADQFHCSARHLSFSGIVSHCSLQSGSQFPLLCVLYVKLFHCCQCCENVWTNILQKPEYFLRIEKPPESFMFTLCLKVPHSTKCLHIIALFPS